MDEKWVNCRRKRPKKMPDVGGYCGKDRNRAPSGGKWLKHEYISILVTNPDVRKC